MTNLKFRLLLKLLSWYGDIMDQHDSIKLKTDCGNDLFVQISLSTEYPKAFREIKWKK
jgi:hypothetical protein